MRNHLKHLTIIENYSIKQRGWGRCGGMVGAAERIIYCAYSGSDSGFVAYSSCRHSDRGQSMSKSGKVWQSLAKCGKAGQSVASVGKVWASVASGRASVASQFWLLPPQCDGSSTTITFVPRLKKAFFFSNRQYGLLCWVLLCQKTKVPFYF